MKSIKPQPLTPRKKAKNLNIDTEVSSLFDAYCAANRQAGSPSREVEEFMISTIASKGRAYGLRLPARLAPK